MNHAIFVLGKELGAKRNTPKNKDGKGVHKYPHGNKPWRMIIAAYEKYKSFSAKYFATYPEAVDAYLEAHLLRYGTLPTGKYICPDSGIVIFDGSLVKG